MLDPNKIREMDKITGLSDDRISQMDQVTGLGETPQLHQDDMIKGGDWLTGRAESPLGKVGVGAVNLLSVPSYAVGGVLESASDPEADMLASPFRGVSQKQDVMTALPKSVGLDPDSLEGMAIGFIGEILLPAPPAAGALKTMAKPITAAARKAQRAVDFVQNARNTPVGKMVEELAEQAADNPAAAKMIENLSTPREVKQGSSLAGKMMSGIFENLTSPERRGVGSIHKASEWLADKIGPGTSMENLQSLATKITGYDANQIPGFLQHIKMSALEVSGRLPVDEITGLGTRLSRSVDFGTINKNAQELVERVARGEFGGISEISMKPGDVGVTAAKGQFHKFSQDIYELKQQTSAIMRDIYKLREGARHTSGDEATLRILSQLTDQIDEVINAAVHKTGAFKEMANPAVVRKMVESFTPDIGREGAIKLADEIAALSKGGIQDINRMEAIFVTLSRGVDSIYAGSGRGNIINKMMSASLGSAIAAASAAGVVGGVAAGPAGAIIASLGGAFIGPVIMPIIRASSETALPRALTTASWAARKGGDQAVRFGETVKKHAPRLGELGIRIGGREEREEEGLGPVPRL